MAISKKIFFMSYFCPQLLFLIILQRLTAKQRLLKVKGVRLSHKLKGSLDIPIPLLKDHLKDLWQMEISRRLEV